MRSLAEKHQLEGCLMRCNVLVLSLAGLLCVAGAALARPNAYGVGQRTEQGPSVHGIQYLPDARPWPKGSKLVQ